MKILLKEKVGEYCVDRKNEETHRDGLSILEFINNRWDEEKEFVISLNGVKIITPSFIDEAFGKLALYHALPEMREKIKFENVDNETKSRINQIVANRIKHLVK